MSSPLLTEWLNENSLRAYPVKEDCLRLAVDADGMQLPNYVLVDFVLTVGLDTPVQVYLKQLAIIGNLLTLAFYDQSDVAVTLLSVNLDTHVANAGYSLTGTGTYSDVCGRVVLGDLTNLKTDVPEGLYSFTLADTEMETTTVRPDIRGVRSFQVSQDGTDSQYLYGHVKLVSGANTLLTYLPGYNAVRIDALSGDGLTEECDCGSIGQATVVKTINGIAVEDFNIVGDGSCVSVTTSGNTITITDTCSKPCCGCPELEFLTDSLKVLDVTVTNLQTYSLRLAERIDNFVTNFILTIK